FRRVLFRSATALYHYGIIYFYRFVQPVMGMGTKAYINTFRVFKQFNILRIAVVRKQNDKTCAQFLYFLYIAVYFNRCIGYINALFKFGGHRLINNVDRKSVV